MMDKWITPLNFGLSILIIAALAMITADLAGNRLKKSFPLSAKTALTPPASQAGGASEELSTFGLILEQGLFGSATRGKLVPVVVTQEKAAPTLNQADLILLGSVVGSFRETFALIQKNSTKEERVFRLGDSVFDGGGLVSVNRDFAEILSGGKRIKILSPNAPPGTGSEAPTAAAAVPVQPGGLATQTGSGSFVIDQRALNATLDNIGQAMTDARLLPSTKEGKVEGFKVSEVRPTGVFAMVGIKNGDVLLRINDFPIDSPEKAIQSFASLKGQSRIKLDLIREGQPSVFNYDIR